MNRSTAVLACALLSAALCVQHGDRHRSGISTTRETASPPHVRAPIVRGRGIHRAIYRTLKATPTQVPREAV
jgi:hypothetical protein